MQIYRTIVATRYKQIHQIVNPWEEEIQLHLIFFDVRWIRSLGLFLIRDVLCRTIPLLHDNHHHAKDACTVQSYWTWKTFLINMVLPNVRSPIATATVMPQTVAIAHLQKTTKCLMLIFDMLDHMKRRGDCLSFEMQGGRPAICRLPVCLFQSMVKW